MASDWSTVESIIEHLGSICSAADTANASFAARAAIAQAVREATEAVSLIIEDPPERTAIVRAEEALEVAVEVIGALTSEAERSRQLCADAAHLRARSRELIASTGRAPAPGRGSK